ncbi:MAG: deoxyribose-phosphate aldolase, partial [Candidatus Thermoplasmatota archaeon]
SKDRIYKLCWEAKEYNFGAVCVNPYYVPLAYKLLKGSDVKVCSVVGFPFGATTTLVKLQEAIEAVKNGAEEIDMVMNICAFLSGKEKDYQYVRDEINKVVDGCKVTTKVIIEVGFLTDEGKEKACKLAQEAGAHFVKTATGFGPGAKIKDVRLMRRVVGKEMGVKAAGGIKSYGMAMAFINAGANRIGTSSGVSIMEGI